jgi:hypothetical protein
MNAENVTNTLTGNNPDMSINRSTFGQVTSPRQGYFGRVLQYNFILCF